MKIILMNVVIVTVVAAVWVAVVMLAPLIEQIPLSALPVFIIALCASATLPRIICKLIFGNQFWEQTKPAHYDEGGLRYEHISRIY